MEFVVMRDARRNPWLAGLLSALLPGLGQVYNGQLLLGVAAYSWLLALLVVTTQFTASSFAGLVATVAFAVVSYLAVIGHAALSARRVGQLRLRWFNNPITYLVLFFAVPLLAGRLFYPRYAPYAHYRAFRVPTTGMEPAVARFDQLIVNCRYYRTNPPSTGEVACFRYPVDPSRVFIKRCVAGPGDTVEIRDKQLWVNGALVAEPFAAHRDARPRNPVLDAMVPNQDWFGPYVVPEQSWFCLGDHRDSSVDSRSFGAVPRDLLFGKVLYVYWSLDRARIGNSVN